MAVLYAMLVIGEAANQISEEAKSELPVIDWKRIVGFRHIAAHEYFNIEIQRVWEIIQTDLPGLVRHLSRYLRDAGYELGE